MIHDRDPTRLMDSQPQQAVVVDDAPIHARSYDFSGTEWTCVMAKDVAFDTGVSYVSRKSMHVLVKEEEEVKHKMVNINTSIQKRWRGCRAGGESPAEVNWHTVSSSQREEFHFMIGAPPLKGNTSHLFYFSQIVYPFSTNFSTPFNIQQKLILCICGVQTLIP